VKPPPFSYYDPRHLAEAIELLGQHDNAMLLAGGQSLMPMLNMRFVLPDHLIDLNRVDELSYIREGADGGIEIGAMTRQRDIEISDAVRRRCPLMAEAIGHVGHRQTRNRGTLGGSLCHLDPAAELVTVAAALDATIEIAGPGGTREVAAADFPVTYMTPAIEAGELLTAVRFAPWAERHGHAFVEFARRHGDFAIVSAAALLEIDGERRIRRAALTIGGIGPAPVRVRDAEDTLTGEAPDEALFRDASERCRGLEAMEDVHASAAYRQHLAAVLAQRALHTAHQRALAAQV
jgi:carbon-monoxide dehydrogenase medium subunit